MSEDAFDFEIGFQSIADNLAGELEERKEYGRRALKFNVPFLDELLRGIAPHDLVLLGAPTGTGKTELIQHIASSNARRGKRVHVFALEAERREIERRRKYGMLAQLAHQARQQGAASLDVDALNYRDWYFGRCEHIVGDFNEAADRMLAQQLAAMRVYYRGKDFTPRHVERLFQAVQDQTDLIILDHLHYVDLEGDDENAELAKLIKLVRSISLEMGKPVILVGHLRKRDMRSRALIPDVEAFHGSSNLSKVATIAVMLAPAHVVPGGSWYEANTFFYVPKDRMGGSSGLVAVCRFDRRFKTYDQNYTLGRMTPAGDAWNEIPLLDVPRWATGHISLERKNEAVKP